MTNGDGVRMLPPEPYVAPDVFLRLFGEFELELRSVMHADKERKFSSVVRDGVVAHPTLRNRRGEMRDILELRNVIAHGNNRVGKALPTRETADTLDGLLSLVRLLNGSLSPILKRPAPKEFRDNDVLSDALAFMASNDFSQVPVRAGDGALDLLTAIDVSEWLATKVAASETLLDLRDHSLREILQIAGRKSERKFELASRTATIGDVEARFVLAVQREYDNLFCILVTQGGRPKEPILGIVTAWDLMHLPTL